MEKSQPYHYVIFAYDVFKDTIFVIGLAFLLTALARVVFGVPHSYDYAYFDLLFVIMVPFAFVIVFLATCVDRAVKGAMRDFERDAAGSRGAAKE
jgi:hypothetical protein